MKTALGERSKNSNLQTHSNFDRIACLTTNFENRDVLRSRIF